MTDAEKIAAFLASKGATKVPTGASNGVTDRQWYAASQGKIDLRSRLGGKSDNELIEERHVRGDVVYNGLGEVIDRL